MQGQVHVAGDKALQLIGERPGASRSITSGPGPTREIVVIAATTTHFGRVTVGRGAVDKGGVHRQTQQVQEDDEVQD